jgi:hypothetical protein
MNLGYLSAFIKPDEKSSIAASMRYFSMGNILYTGLEQQDLGNYKPFQLAIDAAYSRKLTDNFSIGTAFRYIVTSGDASIISSAENTPALKAIAADISAYYTHPLVLFGTEARLSAGFNLSNISRVIQFSHDSNKYYLPTNLKLGSAATFQLDELNEFSFAVDLNELLIPVQYMTAAPDGTAANKDLRGLTKVGIGSGIEYTYRNQFAVRAGYLYENPKLGSRRYPTFGAGFKFKSLDLDIAYLAASIQKSPLGNSLRFTLMFTFGQD